MVTRGSDRVYLAFVYCILILLGLICFLPMLYAVIISLSPYEEYVRQSGVILFPKTITLEAYLEFWKEPYMLDSLLVTTVSTIGGTILNVCATVTMAYPLAQKNLVFKKFFIFYALLPMMISGGIIPGYLVVKNTGMTNTIWAYMIPGLIATYNLMLVRTFFSQIDAALPEAARIDGASEFRILTNVILPVSKPILATIALMYGVGHWNEYFRSKVYITSPELRTLQAVLREMLDRSSNAEMGVEAIVPTRTMQMAGVVFVALPIIAVYPFLQKHFTQGMMLGSVKG